MKFNHSLQLWISVGFDKEIETRGEFVVCFNVVLQHSR